MKETLPHERKAFIDISKCILIILVVIGHAGFSGSKYIYWFHMPAFFIISGYLIKPVKDFDDYFLWVKNVFKKLAVPYIIYYTLDALIFNINNFNIINFGKILTKGFYGGRVVSGVFWFITCLFLSEVIFKYLLLKLDKTMIILIVLIFYVCAHAESILFISTIPLTLPIYLNFPWNLDVCLIAIPYLAIGYYLKYYIDVFTKNNIFSISVFMLSIFVMILNLFNIINYNLDMKYSRYTHIVLDIVIPILFTLCILILSRLIHKYFKSTWLEFIGRNSLIIMYLHVPLNFVFSQFFHYGIFIYVMIGTIIPIMCVYFVNKFSITKFIFLGDMKL